jgi:hypothetical protein
MKHAEHTHVEAQRKGHPKESRDGSSPHTSPLQSSTHLVVQPSNQVSKTTASKPPSKKIAIAEHSQSRASERDRDASIPTAWTPRHLFSTPRPCCMCLACISKHHQFAAIPCMTKPIRIVVNKRARDQQWCETCSRISVATKQHHCHHHMSFPAQASSRQEETVASSTVPVRPLETTGRGTAVRPVTGQTCRPVRGDLSDACSCLLACWLAAATPRRCSSSDVDVVSASKVMV